MAVETFNLYANHLGGYYAVNVKNDVFEDDEAFKTDTIEDCPDCDGFGRYCCGDFDPLYCEQCGDSDYFVGSFDYSGDLPDDVDEYKKLLSNQARILDEDYSEEYSD